MTTTLPQVWTWGEPPEAVAVPKGLEVIPMTLAPVTFGVDPGEAPDPAIAIAAADEYVEALLEAVPIGRPFVPCLRFFADRPGEGIARDSWFPWWAVAGRHVATRLAKAWRGNRDLRGLVLHAEDRRRDDGVLDRRLRDERLEAALLGLLGRWLPGVPIAGYGVRYARSATASVSTYGQRPAVESAWATALEVAAGRGVVPWIPYPGFLRDHPRYADLPLEERAVSALDVAHGFARAIDHGSPAVCLWIPDSEANSASWNDALAACGMAKRHGARQFGEATPGGGDPGWFGGAA